MNNKPSWFAGLTEKQRQWLRAGTIVLGLVAALWILLAVFAKPIDESGRVVTGSRNQPRSAHTTNVEMPGQHVDRKDAWMGSAGKDVAEMRQRLPTLEREVQSLRAELQRRDEDTQKRLREQEHLTRTPAPATNEFPTAAVPGTELKTLPPPPPPPPARSTAGRMPQGVPSAVGEERVLAPNAGLIRVSLQESIPPGAASSNPTSDAKAARVNPARSPPTPSCRSRSPRPCCWAGSTRPPAARRKAIRIRS